MENRGVNFHSNSELTIQPYFNVKANGEFNFQDLIQVKPTGEVTIADRLWVEPTGGNVLKTEEVFIFVYPTGETILPAAYERYRSSSGNINIPGNVDSPYLSL